MERWWSNFFKTDNDEDESPVIRTYTAKSRAIRYEWPDEFQDDDSDTEIKDII